jgi:hypothetical protein
VLLCPRNLNENEKEGQNVTTEQRLYQVHFILSLPCPLTTTGSEIERWKEDDIIPTPRCVQLLLRPVPHVPLRAQIFITVIIAMIAFLALLRSTSTIASTIAQSSHPSQISTDHLITLQGLQVVVHALTIVVLKASHLWRLTSEYPTTSALERRQRRFTALHRSVLMLLMFNAHRDRHRLDMYLKACVVYLHHKQDAPFPRQIVYPHHHHRSCIGLQPRKGFA